ncbi:uncharacterized protein NECHADRAFT_76998 [Fusarium vanettenii 77-13-4]|uniref:Uncharacterized protein n=1 Tax=Fusarium vanettenii (strain ATCC MYA-4622 / CBS 123669 / FGSC 9596 / NRRL 45880 / 77-13-4) TaxID=660122 RepID=C7ZCC0_FUSV7|nr:uncharacterized protein NECHADRAFT_76998 [Fusarium vanettenii 77-13-4]EEU38233.1 hypothetical protein NECHADRAFT_76998 [Fusarium vanettenii 77-13-4]
MDQCQTADEHRLTRPTGGESHTVPDHSGLVQESCASSGETLPGAPSQQSAELESFILPPKSTANLSSMTCVSPSPPQALIPGTPRFLFRVWALEAASLLLSFSCFIGKFKATASLALSLTRLKGLPDWPLSITLNSFLAFFTTLIKAAFMLPVSTAISQMKWSWFLQDRPIYDFHILDQASRGLHGSLMLLWRARFKSFISLGAVIIITSTLTSPITQLAINYPMRDREVPRGAYTRAIRKIETPSDFLHSATSKAIHLATVLDNSLLNNPMPPLKAFCSTGNCTFDKYHTLGVCVKLANISSHLKIESFKGLESQDLLPLDREFLTEMMLPRGIRVWKASLSEQLYLLHWDPFPFITDILNGISTVADIQLANGSVKVSDTFWHEAWEVLFYLCVQSYRTKVQMGVDETRMVSSIAMPMEPKDNAFLDTKCPPILYAPQDVREKNSERRNETLFLRGPAENSSRPGSHPEAFSANYLSLERTAEALRDGLTSRAMGRYYGLGFASPSIRASKPTEFLRSLYTAVLFHPQKLLNHTARYNSLDNLYLNVATALSSVIRRADLNYTEHGFNVTGKAWTSEAYVQIQWGWLSFLAFELVLAASLLAMTIATQKGNQKADRENYDMVCDLKDSSLAALVALDSDCRSVMGDGLVPVKELEKTAKEVHMRLSGNKLVTVAATDDIQGN